MGVDQRLFGKTNEGQDIILYTISNLQGTKIKVTNLGGVLVSICFKDKNDQMQDLVLGFETGEDYLKNGPHFGSVIGRNANRIENSSFLLNHKKVQLTPNENKNNLHSGPVSYDQMIWDAKVLDQGVAFHRISPDGEQGFPGNLALTVTYTLKEDNTMEIHYEGVSDQDTVVNMTNHSYFNLGGHQSGKVYKHILQLNAEKFTPFKDSASIPTGEIAPVKGTPMDFTQPKEIGKEIGADFYQLKIANGYDHNYLINKEKGKYDWMAKVWCRETGIMMEAFTDCPAVQFYTANFVSEDHAKEDASYRETEDLTVSVL